MKWLKFLVAFTVISTTDMPAVAQRFTNSDAIATCNHISYLVTEEGRCIDLSSLTNQGTLINDSLSRKFFRSLRSKGITVTNYKCEEEVGTIRYGFYRPADRTLNLCEDRIPLKERNAFYSDQYLDTIAHESVHAVQHCVGNPNGLTPIASYRTELWQQYVSILGYEKTQDILDTYDDASNPHNDYEKALEVEAWALAKKPELVLNLFQELC